MTLYRQQIEQIVNRKQSLIPEILALLDVMLPAQQLHLPPLGKCDK